MKEEQKQAIDKAIKKAPTVYEMDGPLKAQLLKRGIDEHGWNTLKSSLFPGASDRSILLAVDYCKARGLDVLKKPVHIVSMWNSSMRSMVDVIMPGITEIRITAMRTGEYAGNDGGEFGPAKVLNFEEDGKTYELTVPEWCRHTVRRMIGGKPCTFVGPMVYWEEAYATKSNKTNAPNSMWRKRARGQLEKCSEAAALRMAFPEALGSDYAYEEMEGKIMRDVTPRAQQSDGGDAIAKAIEQAKNETEQLEETAASEAPPETFDFNEAQDAQYEESEVNA